MFSRNLSRSPFSRTFYQQADAASGAVADNSAANQNPQPQTNNQNAALSPLEKAVTDILARNNNSERDALAVSVGEAHRLRQRLETAESKVGKIPDDVQAELDAYRALGKSDELKARLETGDAATAANTKRVREDGFRKAATAAGYDADALLEVVGDTPETEVKPEKRDGKDVEVAYWRVPVEGKEGETEAKAFSEIVAQRFPKTHEAMKAQQATSTRKEAPIMGVQGAPVNTDEAARKSQESLYSSSNF